VFGPNQLGPIFDSVLDFKSQLGPTSQSPSLLPLARVAGHRLLPLLSHCTRSLLAREHRVLEHPDPSSLITPSSLRLYLVGQVSAQRPGSSSTIPASLSPLPPCHYVTPQVP
jgi:hypothetical protein